MAYAPISSWKTEDLGATRLLQVAEEIEEIKTICKCGHKATCNARFVDGHFMRTGEDIVIDGILQNIEYIPMCYKCYSLADAMYNEPHSNQSHLPY